jgi:hypothetical protein
MQQKEFYAAADYFAKSLDFYRKNDAIFPNLYKKQQLEIMFLSGLNQFYAKNYSTAFEYALQAWNMMDTIQDNNTYLPLKAYCRALMGVAKERQGKEIKQHDLQQEGFRLYKDAQNIAANNSKVLSNIKYLRDYNTLNVYQIVLSVGIAAIGLGGSFLF